jgi:hypothetical protein
VIAAAAVAAVVVVEIIVVVSRRMAAGADGNGRSASAFAWPGESRLPDDYYDCDCG